VEQPNQKQISLKKFDISLIEFDKNEKIICEIRKHYIGLVVTVLTGLLIATVLFVTIIVLSVVITGIPDEGTVDQGLAANIAYTIGGLVVLGTILATFIGGYIYQHNVMLVTSDKIAQVLYKTIFDRKVSQLSITDIQDVTVIQSGVLPRIFNYGTITIETAGEQQNYTFTYAPNPYARAKDIITAHEYYEEQFSKV
jgi:hypothetical protein